MPVGLLVPTKRLNCVLITGFHGIGLTGYIAVTHLINTFRAERIGYIETEFMPPLVFMNADV